VPVLALYAQVLRLIINTNKRLLLDADPDCLADVFVTGNMLFLWACYFKNAEALALPCRLDVQALVLEALSHRVDTRPPSAHVTAFEKKYVHVLAWSSDILQESYNRTRISVRRIAEFFADKFTYPNWKVQNHYRVLYSKLPNEEQDQEQDQVQDDVHWNFISRL
jgi:hypothetical protein